MPREAQTVTRKARLVGLISRTASTCRADPRRADRDRVQEVIAAKSLLQTMSGIFSDRFTGSGPFEMLVLKLQLASSVLVR